MHLEIFVYICFSKMASSIPHPGLAHTTIDPDTGIERRFPALQADYLLSEPPGKPKYIDRHTKKGILLMFSEQVRF